MTAGHEGSGGGPGQVGELRVLLVNNSDEQAGTQGTLPVLYHSSSYFVQTVHATTAVCEFTAVPACTVFWFGHVAANSGGVACLAAIIE